MTLCKPLEKLEFGESHPRAEPILVHAGGRILRFCLKPGQRLREHQAPHSPVHIVVLRGRGMFAGEDGEEALVEAGGLVVFAPGELHRARALEEMVFVALLEPAPAPRHRKSALQPEEDAYLTWPMCPPNP